MPAQLVVWAISLPRKHYLVTVIQWHPHASWQVANGEILDAYKAALGPQVSEECILKAMHLQQAIA
jgi:hypothetical protein